MLEYNACGTTPGLLIHLLFHALVYVLFHPPISLCIYSFIHQLLFLTIHPSIHVSHVTHLTEYCCGLDLVWELELPPVSHPSCSPHLDEEQASGTTHPEIMQLVLAEDPGGSSHCHDPVAEG